jgi:hypothetical protein
MEYVNNPLESEDNNCFQEKSADILDQGIMYEKSDADVDADADADSYNNQHPLFEKRVKHPEIITEDSSHDNTELKFFDNNYWGSQCVIMDEEIEDLLK